MGLVESKPESKTPGSVDVQPVSNQRKLKEPHPMIVEGKQIATSVAGHDNDDFGAVNPSTKRETTLNAHQRATSYALLGRKHVPSKLAEGLRAYRRIRRKKQEEKARQDKPPIYSPFEDPPEIE